ncbi:MAG: phosphopantothenoylcysteine decarboxylase [Candidatus Omnitrophota bacterium]
MKKNKLRIVVSSGPTREPIDPVRFISNYSTGVLGYKIAEIAQKKGHKVVLVSGPVDLKKPQGIKLIKVETAREMKKVLLSSLKNSDCLIMNAAVCDYRPLKFSRQKLKKENKGLHIELVENPDILKALSSKKANRLMVGFALETENLFNNAFLKLKKKKLDLIVGIKAGRYNSPFGLSKISPWIIDKTGGCEKLSNITKQKLSQKLLDRIEGLWYTKIQS